MTALSHLPATYDDRQDLAVWPSERLLQPPTPQDGFSPLTAQRWVKRWSQCEGGKPPPSDLIPTPAGYILIWYEVNWEHYAQTGQRRNIWFLRGPSHLPHITQGARTTILRELAFRIHFTFKPPDPPPNLPSTQSKLPLRVQSYWQCRQCFATFVSEEKALYCTHEPLPPQEPNNAETTTI